MLLLVVSVLISVIACLTMRSAFAVVPAKFTERARMIIDYANEEAIRLNHKQIDTEHLLLGVVHEGQGIAARALQELDVNLKELESELYLTSFLTPIKINLTLFWGMPY